MALRKTYTGKIHEEDKQVNDWIRLARNIITSIRYIAKHYNPVSSQNHIRVAYSWQESHKRLFSQYRIYTILVEPILNEDYLYNISQTMHDYAYKTGTKKGLKRNPKLAKRYKSFEKNYYLPMKNKVLSMSFDVNNPDSFQDCAVLFNSYYAEIKRFMKKTI